LLSEVPGAQLDGLCLLVRTQPPFRHRIVSNKQQRSSRPSSAPRVSPSRLAATGSSTSSSYVHPTLLFTTYCLSSVTNKCRASSHPL
jgi:hypothetical protein